MTSIWPRPATASTEAICSMLRSDVDETLDGAATALITNSSTVAVPMVTRPRETATRGPAGMVGRAESALRHRHLTCAVATSVWPESL